MQASILIYNDLVCDIALAREVTQIHIIAVYSDLHCKGIFAKC